MKVRGVGLAVVLLLGMALPGCDHKVSSSTATEPITTEPIATEPPPRAIQPSCRTAYPKPLINTALVASCQSKDEQSGFIKNLSNATIDIEVTPGTADVTFTLVPAKSTLAHSILEQQGIIGPTRTGYELGPQDEVIASNRAPGGPDLTLQFDPVLSIDSIAASHIQGLVDKFTTPKSTQVLRNAVTCVSGVQSAFTTLQRSTSESSFVDAMFQTSSCLSLYSQYHEATGESIKTSEFLAKIGSSKVPEFGEIIDELGKVISLIH